MNTKQKLKAVFGEIRIMQKPCVLVLHLFPTNNPCPPLPPSLPYFLSSSAFHLCLPPRPHVTPPSFTSRPLRPPLLSSTCAPAEGEFRRRGNPRGSQAPHRWLANYTFITSPLLFLPPFLWPALHNDSLFHLTSVSG